MTEDTRPATGPNPRDRVRSLLRVRQVREFTDQPLTADELEAITEVARWSGSSRNSQPWRFIVIQAPAILREIAERGMPQTRSLRTARAAVAIVLPADPRHEIVDAYDDGRAAERILIAASFLDLGGGIAWVRSDVREPIGELLGLPADRMVRTLVALGHPSEAGRRPKSPPGQARQPREALIFEERWPSG